MDAVFTNMEELPEVKNSQPLASAIVIIDNVTGDIVAIAGDVGQKTVSDAFSHATDEGKQIGSSAMLTRVLPRTNAELIAILRSGDYLLEISGRPLLPFENV